MADINLYTIIENIELEKKYSLIKADTSTSKEKKTILFKSHKIIYKGFIFSYRRYFNSKLE